MVSQFFPIQLQLANQKIVIVGGGVIAERKLNNLLSTKARITVISPNITEGIQEAVHAMKVRWKQKEFDREDVTDAFIVIAATNSKQVNFSVHTACHKQQLVNLVDDPSQSTFIFPATVNRGKLSISVSTSGASPGLSKKIVHDLSKQYDCSYENYVDFLAECREIVLDRVTEAESRSRILRELLQQEYFDLTKKGLYEERKSLFQQLCNQLE